VANTATVGVLRALLTADTASFDDAMKRAAASADAWTQKMNKLGSEAKGVGDTISSSLGESMLKLTSAMSISHLADRAIEGLIEFGKSAFETSSKLVDMSLKLGISTDALQKYAFVAEQTGTSADAFGQAVFKLGVNLEKGGTATEAALKDLGLSSAQLKALKPEEQFELVAHALGNLTNVQERNRDGVALMGRGYSEIAASMAVYGEKSGQANIVDAERIKALDESNKAYERLKDTISKEFTSAVGSVAVGYERANKAGLSTIEILSHLTTGTLDAAVAAKEHAAELEKAAKMMEGYGKRAANFGQMIDLPADTPAIADTTAVAEAKKKIDALTAAQREQIAAGLQLGKSIEDVGEKYGITGDAAKIYSSYTAELTKKQNEHEAAAKKAAKAEEEVAAALEKAGRAMSKGGVTDAMAKLSAELTIAEKNGGLAKDSLEKYGKQIDEWLNQGYAVDGELSKIHYDWILLNESLGMNKDAMAAVMSASPNLVGTLEAQGAAARQAAIDTKTLNDNLAYFGQLSAKGGSKMMGEILGASPNLKGELKAPPMSFGQSMTSTLVGSIPALTGSALSGAIFGGKGGAGAGAASAAVGVAGQVGGMVGSKIGASVTKSLTSSMAGGVAGMGATIAGGMASMGISVGVQAAIAGVTAVVKHNQNATVKAREDFAKQLGFGDLPKLYSDLAKTSEAGQKLADVGQHVIGKQDTAANEKWMKDVQAFYADIAAKQKQLNDDFGKLGGALEAFGGVAPKALKPMIDELMKMPGLTDDMKATLTGLSGDPSWQTMQDHAEKLGINLAALGPKFQSSKLTDIALGYARDIQMFADAGADVPEVLRGMSDELSTLYQNSAKNGVALPATLKPYMEQLQRMGLLVDENGVKVDNLDKVAFKDIPDTALKDVVDVLKEIKDLLTNKLPEAADKGAQGVQDAFAAHPVTIPVTYDDAGVRPTFGHTGSSPMPQPQIGLEGGTHGAFVDWGSGTNVTLHGREAVVPSGETLTGTGGAPIEITVISQLDGRAIARSQVRYLPRELTLAGV
jgi:hypothetical protein